MGKLVKRLILDDMYTLGRNEGWFSDMAKKGLHLKGFGRIFVHFEKGEPKETNYNPLGLQAVPDSEIVRIHSSSGTTGTPVIIPYTRQDVGDWAEMFKRCHETAGLTNLDRVHITPGYGLWTAGIGFQAGAELLGAMVIPMGPDNTDKQIQMMKDLKSTVLCATSSYALLFFQEQMS